MFRVTLRPTEVPNEYDLYVADVEVDRIRTHNSVELMEEYFSYINVFYRCLVNQDPTETELSILAAVEGLSMMFRL